MKIFLIAILAFSIAGCNSTAEDRENTRVQPAVKSDGAFYELDGEKIGPLQDGDEVKTGDYAPESALKGITKISSVREVPWEKYIDMSKESGFEKKDIRNGYIYFDIHDNRCVPFPNGDSAIVGIVERYRTREKKE
ncbi:MAG: hypothetical protein ACYS8W_00670 [Planctomycetota bacterium]|jgi:hypothetical protein